MSTTMKRLLPEEANDSQSPAPKRVLSMSFAAKLNAKIMRQLQKVLEADPEVDLTTVIPAKYSSRLQSRKSDEANVDELQPLEESDTVASDELLPITTPTDPAQIVHPLSDQVKALLNIRPDELGSMPSVELTRALVQTLKEGELIWQSESTKERYVVRCGPDLVIKSIRSSSDFTEYTSLQYLELHSPQIPVPRPHGLIRSGRFAFLFMSFVPGVTLEKIWPELQDSQKESLSSQLDAIFSNLRQLQRPDTMALGGVAGEGCKDARRHIKVSDKPLYTSAEFWKFQYAGFAVGSPTFLEFLRQLTLPIQAEKCVFSHGDVRKANIIVRSYDKNVYQVVGIIDWEMSGFYPEDFECTKITNTLATNETDDWYLHLPSCISPARFLLKWLADSVWDKQVV